MQWNVYDGHRMMFSQYVSHSLGCIKSSTTSSQSDTGVLRVLFFSSQIWGVFLARGLLRCVHKSITKSVGMHISNILCSASNHEWICKTLICAYWPIWPRQSAVHTIPSQSSLYYCATLLLPPWSLHKCCIFSGVFWIATEVGQFYAQYVRSVPLLACDATMQLELLQCTPRQPSIW